MGEWIDFSEWANCERYARPGYVFEVANAQGQTMRTPCQLPLARPWDWTSGPVRFRLAPEDARPRRSSPIPPALK